MALGLLKALLISLQQCAQRHSSVQWPANSLLPVRSAHASVTDARVQVKWNKFLNTDLAEKARADGKLTLADMAQVMNWKMHTKKQERSIGMQGKRRLQQNELRNFVSN